MRHGQPAQQHLDAWVRNVLVTLAWRTFMVAVTSPSNSVFQPVGAFERRHSHNKRSLATLPAEQRQQATPLGSGVRQLHGLGRSVPRRRPAAAGLCRVRRAVQLGDHNVGQILSALQSSGLAERTNAACTFIQMGVPISRLAEAINDSVVEAEALGIPSCIVGHVRREDRAAGQCKGRSAVLRIRNALVGGTRKDWGATGRVPVPSGQPLDGGCRNEYAALWLAY
jgi:hypothetical protein